MGTVAFTRPKRVPPPPMPKGDLLLESPPEIPPPPASKGFSSWLRMLPMVAGGLAMGVMMMGGGRGGGVMGLVVGGLYAVSMAGMMMSQVGRGNDDQAQQLDSNRRDYFRYLGQTRRSIKKVAEDQRQAVAFRHPDPEGLWTIIGGPRMWERRAEAEDFASIRVSVGSQQSARRITPPEAQPIDDLEPLATGALRRFIRTHRLVPSVPLSIDLRGFTGVQLVGDEDACRRLAYAMVAQLVTWHAPTDVALMVCAHRDQQDNWRWVKWLPHLQHPSESDGVGPVRLFATSAEDLSPLAASLQGAGGHHSLTAVVVDHVDGITSSSFATPTTPAITIEVTGSESLPKRLDYGVAVFEVRDGQITLHRRTSKGQHAKTPFGTPDGLPRVHLEMLARLISPYRIPPAAAEADGEVEQVVFEPPKDYPTMLGVGDPLTLDVRSAWRARPLRNHLRIPFGTAENGSPVELDIKESAQGGMGPHGICIGATGSGKSEFLRTLVLGLAMTHSTEQLNFILVDFKGGATFLGLDELPHVSAVITNLEGELALVDRMQDAIGGELDRRMEVLRSAGNFKNREDYEAARQAGADIPPMPSLFIVVDEFSELLTARPEFIDLFVQIGRVGRSIAVHQLLASQRLEENKLRGLDTFLSYRIALRTFSPAESRTVIGVPDAYELPTPPGNGYLKFDTTGMTRFKAAYVSGPWHGSPTDHRRPTSSGPDEFAAVERSGWVPPVLEFTTEFVPEVTPPAPPPKRSRDADDPGGASAPAEDASTRDTDEEEDETLLSLVVGRLTGHGWPAHKVWLPPLDDPPTMDQLLGGLVVDPQRGLMAANPASRGLLQAPIGLIDKPRHQRRDPWWLDFSGSGGHMGIVGGPQSGKSMGLRAAIAGLSLTHTPQEVGFYCLDFGGGALTSMRSLAHMGSVTGRLDVDRVRRTVAEINSLRSSREVLFTELGIDSMATYRRGRRDGTYPADRFPTDVFLVIDGWLTLKQEFDTLEPTIAALAAGGLGFGIHVWVSANKWTDMRANLKDTLQTKVELKLGDAFDSEIDRKLQALVPTGRPGRGITLGGLHTLIGLPRIDSVENADDVSQGQRAMIEAINSAWQGPRAAEVRLLPDSLPLAALPAISYDGTNRSIPYAIDELELEPVSLEPASDPHLVVFGGPECGKSSLLKVLLKGITTRYTPAEARIVIVDYRRSLLGEVETDHLIGYYPSAAAAQQNLKDAAEAVRSRLPGPDVTQQQLRDRSWWKGSDFFIVVDDYELVATSSGNPLAAFADLVNQASDVGLHIIIARGFGGASRVAYGDPIVSKMKESQSPAIIMSGNKDEGQVWGDVRGTSLPPGRGTLITRSFTGLVQIANPDAEQ